MTSWPGHFFQRSLRRSGMVLLAVLSLGLLRSWSSAPEGTTTASTGQLVHWRGAGHDWLLVVDPATGELVVYDANDGRPLNRLGADDGLPQVQAIALRGSWLYVTSQPQAKTRLLRLPELRTIAAKPIDG